MTTIDSMFYLVAAALAPFMIWRSVRMLKSPVLLREYIETSPKAQRLKDKLGVEPAMELTRRRYLPLGIATWGLVGVLAIFQLGRLLTH